jgi:Tol biopolymer transport system component
MMKRTLAGASLALLLFAIATPALAGGARPVSPEHDGNAMNPVWSPDGTLLSYEVAHSAEKYTELFLLTVDGGGEQRIGPPAGAGGLGGRFLDKRQVNHEFTWAPGGQLYAFASSGSDDDFDLYIKGVTVPIGTEDKEGGASFSSDGRYIAYCSAATGDGDLYLLDIYALEEAPTRITWGSGLDFYAAWSPDGMSLAYTAMSEEGSNIRLISDAFNARDTDTRLTAWTSTQIKPSWSPDGKWVAFFSNHGKDDRTKFDVYAVQAAGGEPFKVLADVVPGERNGPAWTPDSRSIVAVRDDPNAGDPIVRVDLGGGVARTLDTGTANNGEPTVFGRATDGNWKVAFVSQGIKSSDTQAWRRVWVVDMAASSRRGR